MKLKVIACNILWRELSLLAANCPNILDITYMRQEYHNVPDKMRAILNAEIARIESDEDEHTNDIKEGDFDAIVLAYGLCGNGILGLQSSRYPLVIPRAHDCITLLMGSKELYRDYFDNYHGTFWYSTGYIETGIMPSQEHIDKKRDEYVEKYGEEDAEFLLQMELDYINNYKRAAYIEFPGLENEASEAYTQKCAAELNWQYDKIIGSQALLKNMLWGNWNPEDFLIVPPGKTIAFDAGKNIINSVEPS